MNPHIRYRQSTSMAWTRIDMLLLIYDRTLGSLLEGIRILEASRMEELTDIRVASLRSILVLLDGINPEMGELPVRVMQLCLYAIDCVRTDSVDEWRSAHQILATLREGFAEIQEEARRQEYEGRIPAPGTA